MIGLFLGAGEAQITIITFWGDVGQHMDSELQNANHEEFFVKFLEVGA